MFVTRLQRERETTFYFYFRTHGECQLCTDSIVHNIKTFRSSNITIGVYIKANASYKEYSMEQVDTYLDIVKENGRSR